MLAGPSLELRDVLRELVFYSDDAMTTSYAVPDLIPLLAHSNPKVRLKISKLSLIHHFSTKRKVAEKAANIVYDLSRKPAQRSGLTQEPELVNALVAEIKKNRHGEQEKLIMTLRNLSKTPQGVEILYQARTIPELVALLGHKNPKYVAYALDTLHALIRHKEQL